MLFFVDNSISEEHMLKYEQYCKAFYTGCFVKTLKPGDPVPDRPKGSNAKIPRDSLTANKISSRDNDFGK